MNKKPQGFFSGFTWAIPKFFADPLSTCRFEQGDLLYDKAEAYGLPWSQAQSKIGYAIQILEPSRGVATKSSGQDNSAFADNWQQKAVFELFDLRAGESKTLTTTQGRLFSLLWHGDQNILTEKNPPTVPSLAIDLKKILPELTNKFQTELLPNPNLISFLMPCDVAAGLYYDKFLKVKKILESNFQATLQLVAANTLGLDAKFLPTVHVARFEIQGASRSAVEEALQSVLYKPGPSRKTSAVRFRLSAHGVLI